MTGLMLLLPVLACHRDPTISATHQTPAGVTRRAVGLFVGATYEPVPPAHQATIGRLFYLNSDSGTGWMLAIPHAVALCGVRFDSAGQLVFQAAGKYQPGFVGWVTADSVWGRLADRDLVLRPLSPAAMTDTISGAYGDERLGVSGDLIGWSALVVRSGDSLLVLYADDEGDWGQPQAPVLGRLDHGRVRFTVNGRARAIDLAMIADSAHPDIRRMALKDVIASEPAAACGP